MQKIGTIIKIPSIKKKGEQIVTVAFDSNEADLCSIKSTDRRNGCTGCGGGCISCGRNNQETGLFVIQGNVVNALNGTGRELTLGQRVQVMVSKKAVLLQGIYAVGLPLLLSVVFFTLIFIRTKSETLALAGIVGGLLCGSCVAFGINLMTKERALPRVITVYE